VNKRTILDWKM